MKKIIFRGPVQTASGYGVYSRSFLRALDKSGKYDITLMSVPWGSTPLIYEETEEMQRIAEMSKKFDPATFKPENFDASVQITIPNEFMKLAKQNICITAGIEVDRVSPLWQVKTNEVADALIVPSLHAAKAFADAKYQSQTGELLELSKPVHIVPDWIDTSVFNTDEVEQDPRFKYPSKFNFVAMGLGLDRGEGHDRKNFHQLIRWFCEQFNGSEDVGLVLKLSMVNYSTLDLRAVQARIQQIKQQAGCGQFPRIHLIHGRLSDQELAALFKSKSVHAMITLTHGEGYGLPILEAAACGLPVVATDWSGHLDFLTKDGKKLFVPVAFQLKDISAESVWKDVYEAGTKWAWPVEGDAKMKMSKVVISYDKPKEWATELAENIAIRYGKSAEDDFLALFDKLVSGEAVATAIAPTSAAAENQATQFIAAVEELRKRFRAPGRKKLLYTMPESAGDVYLSTGVVKSLKQKFPDHDIVFATSPQFFGILVNNQDIEEFVPWEQWMSNVMLCEMVFDEVYTPNLDVQLLTSNWIHGGKGSRKLAQEFAHRCDVEFQNPVITTIKPAAASELPEKFIAFHTTAISGKWSTRGYQRWEEVLAEIPRDVPIVQIGMPNEPLIKGVDIDFRGKHDGYNQFAWLIQNAEMVIGVDTISMAFAAGFNKPMVTIFGSTYASKTGPTILGNGQALLIETTDRYTCEKACYKNECFVNAARPCINNIEPVKISNAVKELLAAR